MKSVFSAAFKAVVIVGVLSGWSQARAETAPPEPSCKFDAVALQLGAARAGTDSVGLALQWGCPWRKQMAWGVLSFIGDVMVARWRTTPTDELGKHFTQIGITPALRWQPSWLGSAWFIEAGIGANTISPRYHRGHKRFSTEFNFGDHVGFGRRFGADQQYEWLLRGEHFSNGAIKAPNPGENFIQLRYTYYFRP